MTPASASTVKIVEVGPRDGLQNEPESLPVADKLAFIEALAQSGLSEIEVTSFVNPQRIPQLADAALVVPGLTPHPGLTYSALVPNRKGLQRAIDSGIRRIAVFTAASESFTQKNINMTIAESLDTFRPVVAEALAQGISVRGYVSTGFVCPYEGTITPRQVLPVVNALLDMGVDEVSLGDTIGAAVPKEVFETVGLLLQSISAERLALHFHDTYGTALANVMAGLDLGIRIFDASAGGLGGCPYAPGASGNLATEDLVYLLHREGYQTGIDFAALIHAADWVQSHLGRRLPSKQLQRLAGCTPNGGFPSDA